MSKKEGLDVAVGTSRAFLKFIGIWPHFEKKGSLLLRGFILIPIITVLFFINIPQTIMVAKVWGDLNAVLEVLSTSNVPVAVALLKVLGLWYSRKVLGQLLINMSEDWKNAKMQQQQLQVMWYNAKLSRIISIITITLALGTITAHLLMQLQFTVQELNKYNSDDFNATKIIRPLYVKSVFFYNTQRTPLYEITWLMQYCATIFGASFFSSADALFAVLVLHLCGQLKNLRDTIKRLTKQVGPTKENENFVESLRMIVSRHNQLNRFANDIEDTYNVIFLFQIMTSSMVLCLQGYQLIKIATTGDGIPLFELIFVIYYILCFTFSLFVYCYVAEVLRTESMELGNAAYESEWYNLQPSQTRCLILIIVRARNPFEITAGKFAAFSMGFYATILKSSGGYLSMLLAMKERLA